MTKPLLSRRAVAAAVAAVVAVGGLTTAFAADPAAGCSFKDPAGDAAIPGIDGQPDKDLDILQAGYSTTATSLLLSVKLAKLTGTGPDLFAGDDFQFNFTVNKKAFEVGTIRIGDPEGGPPLAVAQYVYVDGTEKDAASLKATYDVKTSVVEVSISADDLGKLAGAPVAGTPVSALSVFSWASTGGPSRKADEAKPAAGVVWTYGASSCGGSAPAGTAPSATAAPSASPSATASPSGSSAPSGSASPSATSTATTAPAGGDGPTPGCVDIADAKGDATPQAPAPNDPDLDIVAVNFQTQPELLKAYIKVDKLGAKPASGNGHRFSFGFTAGTKVVEAYAGQPDSIAAGANAALVASGQSAPASGGVRIGGTYNPTIKTSSVFDVKNSRVVISVDRATLEKALGAPLDGTVLKATLAESRVFTPTAGNVRFDSAQATKPEEQVYRVGDNRCFAAAASAAGAQTLAVSSPLRVQTSDAAAVAVTLTDGSGKGVSGAVVTARLGSGPIARATTDSRGAARLPVRVVDAAGNRSLVVSYAGNSSGAGAVSVRRTTAVVAERSLLNYRISGTGSTRLISVVLTDDDAVRHPYGGAKVTFSYNGRSTTVTTDGSGRASTRVPARTRLDMTYPGRTGYVTAAKRQTPVT